MISSVRGLAPNLDLEDQDKVVAVVIPPKKRNLLEKGRFCGNLLGVVGPCFCWGFGKNEWLDVVFLW